jgi:hypothetical protein
MTRTMDDQSRVHQTPFKGARGRLCSVMPTETTTHASGGDTPVRVRLRACPRAGGFPTLCCIPFPTIYSPAGGVFASTQHLIGAGRATPGRTPLVVGSTPSRSTSGAARPSRCPGPRGDRYGATSPKGKGRHLQAAGHLKSGFDSSRGYPVSFTTTADASHPRGARPNLLKLCLHPSACAVVERGPVRAAALDDNAHDELQR